jgi:hypothetical protein
MAGLFALPAIWQDAARYLAHSGTESGSSFHPITLPLRK